MNGEKLELRHHTEYSKGYQVIVRFFKEIGLLKEFILYQTTSSDGYTKVRTDTVDPIGSFGVTGITNWLGTNQNKKIFIDSTTLFYPFISFVETFYPEFMETKSVLLNYKEKYRNNPPWYINKEEKRIRLFTKEEQTERFLNK